MLMSAMAPTEDRMTRFEHCIGYARKARVKLELLTTTDVAKGLSPHAKEILSLLVLYDLRLNFLPPSFCFDYIDVLAFRDVVLLINQHTEHAEQVVGTDQVLVYNHLLRVAREAGWGMDIRMWLEGVLESNSHHAIPYDST